MSTQEYRDAGVDVQEGRRAVENMRAAVTATHGREVLGHFGSFAGMFALKDYRGTDHPPGEESRALVDPVLVSGADGVGTKVELARAAGRFDTIGVDLVAMCVNDVLCHGALPLFFLDYLAVDTLDARHAAVLVEGVARGCRTARCALLGGETAEMPGVYRPGRFDLAGFAVGVVERAAIIDGSALEAGHVLVGLASSGVHSNGFSLVRHLMPEVEDEDAPQEVRELRDRLLEPTRIYVPVVQDILKSARVTGMAHITGGGWEENLPRLLGVRRREYTLDIRRDAVAVPDIFHEIARRGVDHREMYRTFNMGLGMALAVPPEDVAAVVDCAAHHQVDAWPFGEVRGA